MARQLILVTLTEKLMSSKFESGVAGSANRDPKFLHLSGSERTRLSGSADRGRANLRTEETLQPSEEKYRTLFETMDEGFCIIEKSETAPGQPVDFRWIEGNQAFLTISGIPDIIGRSMRETFPDEAPPAITIYDEIVRTGEPARFEYPMPSLDRTLDLHAFRMVGTDSRRVAVLFQDITKRKRAETALRKSEERQAYLLELSDALRSLADPVEIQLTAMRVLGEHLGAMRAQYYEADPTEQFLASNGGYTDGAPPLVGRVRMDDLGRYVREALRAGRTLVVSDASTDPRVSEEELKSYDALGCRAFVGVPMVKDGRFVVLVGIHNAAPRQWTEQEIALVEETADRTWAAAERAKAEAALQESEERLRLATDLANIGYWDVDLFHNVLIWPARVKAMFGISPDVPVSMDDFYAGLHPEDREKVSEAFASASDPARRTLYDVEYRTIGKEDSVVRWVAAKGRGLFDENGVCVRVIGTAVEITGRREAEQALMRTEKLASMGRMAASVAHEINNPLEAVTNLLYLACMEEGIPSSAKARLELAESELGRVAHITRQSLGFYRETSDPMEVSIADILDSSVDLLKARIMAKNATVSREWKTDLKIVAVSGELRQVFSNLLVNSLDAMERGGKIRMRIAECATAFPEAKPCVRVTIADNGKGILPEARKRIFDPLFTTKGSIGTGLGLWVSKQIVEKHGGRIRMRTCNEGRRTGTVFCVVLPGKARA